MKIEKQAKRRMAFILLAMLIACVLTQGALARAEATNACTNPITEGIEYFQPISFDPAKANQWRNELEVTAVLASDGTTVAGEVVAVEMEVLNLATRYQCTEVTGVGSGHFSCNSVPNGASVSGIYYRIKPDAYVVTENSEILFQVKNAVTDELLMSEEATIEYPPYPCARNLLWQDLEPAEGERMVINNSSQCSGHQDFNFVEPKPEYAIVNIIIDPFDPSTNDNLKPERVHMEVSPAVDYLYTLTYTFEDHFGGQYDVTYDYDPTGDPKYTIDASSLSGVDNTMLPLRFVGGNFAVNGTTKQDLWGNDDYPSATDFDVKFYYENTVGTKGYENSVFHFQRGLNIQFAPYCDQDSSNEIITGVGGAYDYCQVDSQLFRINLIDSTGKGIKVPTNDSECTSARGCTDRSNVTVRTSEPSSNTTYRFTTRKCVDSACNSVTTTSAYPFSITFSDGKSMARTVRTGRRYDAVTTNISMKVYGTSARPFSITGSMFMAHEPGTYVVYGFLSEAEAKKVVPAKYAVKFYVTVPESNSTKTCSTLANNGYFRAYWNDCLSWGETQLMPFEHIAGKEEAWIRNDSYTGVSYPLNPEYSYVPQGLQIASLTCKFEATAAAGAPGYGYCNPDEIYVPQYTRVTITGGTIYLDGSPKFDEYRVAYMRDETMSISHLFFSVQVKECVKKIPDTGISLRSPLKVKESVDPATSFVWTGNYLQIPAIGLGMETPTQIVHVYYEENSADLGWDLSTLGDYVGELEGSTYLPYAGNTTLTGHYYSKGIFRNLEGLRVGDEIIIYGNDGIKYVYHVVEKFLADPSDVYQMFQQLGERSLTLVTCENYNLNTDEYERRQLVRAVIEYQEPYEKTW